MITKKRLKYWTSSVCSSSVPFCTSDRQGTSRVTNARISPWPILEPLYPSWSGSRTGSFPSRGLNSHSCPRTGLSCSPPTHLPLFSERQQAQLSQLSRGVLHQFMLSQRPNQSHIGSCNKNNCSASARSSQLLQQPALPQLMEVGYGNISSCWLQKSCL